MIDTEALRSKILDLAIRGKLTEQLPEDGSAEELYAKIQEEKARLVKEGKIKREKALPEITEAEIPFEIPENWKWVRWGNVINVVSARRVHQSDWRKEGIAFYRAREISRLADEGTVNNDLFISEDLYSEFSKSGVPQCGDLMVTGVGTLGKAYVVKENDKFYYKDASVLCFENYAKLNAPFLKRVMESDLMKVQINSNSGGTTVDTLTMVRMNQYLMPLPPLSEQKRIIDKVNDILERIDEIENFQSQYATNVEVLKSKLIDAGIRGKLTEQLPEDGKVEDLYKEIQIGKAEILESRKGREDKKIKAIENDMPFEIPSHWKWIRLGDIGLFKKGPFGSALTKSIFVQKGEDTVKVYEQQHAIKKDNELGTYYITREYFDEKMSGFEVMPGDIIISCAGTIGETYIMPDKIEQGIINQALMRVTLAEGINKKFFQYYFDANLKKSAQKESNGSAIKNIPPFDVLKNWYFPLTSIEEQGRIVEKIDALLNVFD